MIKIRNAKLEDAQALHKAEIDIAKTPGYLVSRPHELQLSAFQKKIANVTTVSNGKYIVAELDGEILGHALLDPMGLDSIKHVVRLTIAVHPGNEAKGIGYILLTHLIEWAKSNPEVEKIELNVRSSNTRAIRLYQKLGFNIEGRIRYRMKMPDGSYQDDLEMGLFVGPSPLSLSVSSLAIGIVISSRAEVNDDWENVESKIQIDSAQFDTEALAGLSSYSHIEVIFQMNQVDLRKIEISSRHPRNNQSWPKVGIFAQRGQNRPNLLGLTICRVLKIEGLNIWVKGLDAVDGSPVLDIKPWVKEFGPRGEVYQPEWMSELMKDYW